MSPVQGETSREDTIFGAKVLAVFLVFVFALGYTINRLKNWQFRRRWSPLLPMVADPKITEDGGGAATSWLSGSYRGARMYASMTPQISKYSGDNGGFKANRFSVALQNVQGKSDWSVKWDEGIPLFRTAGWVVESKDPVLRARLESAGILERILPLGEAALTYSVRDRALVWAADIEPEIILPPERFRRTLDTLMEIAEIAGSGNAGHTGPAGP